MNNAHSISRLYEMVLELQAKHIALYEALLKHGLTEETYESLLRDARQKLDENHAVKAALEEATPDTLKDAAETLRELT
jgi:putative exporter of polyketide antibiotics